MNSRERVLAALDHREPDRIPVDLCGHRSSGIAPGAYARLRKHLGLEARPIRIYDPIQQLAIVDEDVLQRLLRSTPSSWGGPSPAKTGGGPIGNSRTAHPA